MVIPGCARQVLWLDPSAGVWSCADSDDFYVNLALRSADDARYDGKRPRLRVRRGDLHTLTPQALGFLSSAVGTEALYRCMDYAWPLIQKPTVQLL